MGELDDRFDAWMRDHDAADAPATPAATVLVLRDGDRGPEVLMVKRNTEGTFASAWVFPGGKVDPDDHAPGGSVIDASRRAARREALEEADVDLDEAAMVPFSHWLPPLAVPRRFATWFYLAAAPDGDASDVTVDGGEIVDHGWLRPADVLADHAAGVVDLVPPTWVTLRELSTFGGTGAAIRAAAEREPFFYLTRLIKGDPPAVVWSGDAAYDTGDLDTSGARHRLTMRPGDWSFEHSAG